jgi:hypothetical protein
LLAEIPGDGQAGYLTLHPSRDHDRAWLGQVKSRALPVFTAPHWRLKPYFTP